MHVLLDNHFCTDQWLAVVDETKAGVQNLTMLCSNPLFHRERQLTMHLDFSKHYSRGDLDNTWITQCTIENAQSIQVSR